MKKLSVILIAALLLCLTCTVLADTASYVKHEDLAYSKYGWVVEKPVVDADKCVSVKVVCAGESEVSEFKSLPLTVYNEESYVYRADAVAGVMDVNSFIEILFNADGEIIDYERIERPTGGTSYYLDSQKYGGELTAPGGAAGNMVALGWIMDKGENTITLGDGNHYANLFEETYVLADDVKIYLIDNPGFDANGEKISGTWFAEEGTTADIQITPKNENGEIYWIKERTNALAIFNESAVDENGKTRKDVSSARVTELYLYKNLTQCSATCEPDGVGYNGTSWFGGVDKNVGKTSSGWNGLLIPFAVIEDRLYSFGDGYTNIWVFVSDPDENGNVTMTELDAGNSNSCYSYWLQYDAMGLDPRDLDYCLLTHGHGDHYQGLYELNTMVNRAHGADVLTVQTGAANKDGYLNGVYAGISLSAKPERFVLDKFNDVNNWLYYGEGVDILPVATAGHTNDTTSYLFRLTATENSQYFSKLPAKENGEPYTACFVYMGGYGGGSATKASNGYTRLQYRYSMMYLQSVVTPMAEACADFIWGIPQHGDQAPWDEVAKAWEMKVAEGNTDLAFLDCWNEGAEAVNNLFEKRLSAYAYTWMNNAWLATSETKGDTPVDLYDQIIVPYVREAGYNWFCTPQNTKTEALEVYGPFKRAGGTYDVEITGVTIQRGFNAFQNAGNENLAGIENIYGWDLSNGLSVDRDSYSHDPNGWYVQIVGHVDDDYVGGLYFSEDDVAKYNGLDNPEESYSVNWYVAEGNDYTDFSGKEANPKSGPVESFTGEGWVEVIRTQRLNTKEEAEALAAYVQGLIDSGVTNFSLTMNNAGDIILPEGYISAANCSVDDQFLNTLVDDSIKQTFPGTGYYSLAEEELVIAKCVELNEGIDLTSMFAIAE